MKNRFEVKVISELFNNKRFKDEYFFRNLAHKIVSEMPLEELHKLIKLTKIDPNSDESEKVLRESMDRFKIEQIYQLRSERVILYSAKVDLP
jgi:phosphoenolpyruvate carboxylase